MGPAVTGLIFACHPIHTEAVAGVVGRADLAAANLYLLSFLAYVTHVKHRDTICCTNSSPDVPDHHHHYHHQRMVIEMRKRVLCAKQECCWRKVLEVWGFLGLSVALAVAAMLSKETGVTVIGLCVVYDILRAPLLKRVSVFDHYRRISRGREQNVAAPIKIFPWTESQLKRLLIIN